jgi:hypothetical protein
MTELPFDQWRAEIAERIESTKLQIAEAEGDHERALFEVRSDNARRAKVAEAFAKLSPRQPANALAIRRRGWEQSLDASAGRLAKATNAIAALRRQLADEEQSLEQLGWIFPQSDDDASEAA